MQMRNVILLALRSFEGPKNVASSVAAAAAAAAQGSSAPAVPPAVGQSAQKLADHVFIHCLQVNRASRQ